MFIFSCFYVADGRPYSSLVMFTFSNRLTDGVNCSSAGIPFYWVIDVVVSFELPQRSADGSQKR